MKIINGQPTQNPSLEIKDILIYFLGCLLNNIIIELNKYVFLQIINRCAFTLFIKNLDFY